jgi:hypothetical protein
MIFMEADIQRDIADALESRRARPGNRGFERPGQPLAGSVDSLIGEADVAGVQLASRAELTPQELGIARELNGALSAVREEHVPADNHEYRG